MSDDHREQDSAGRAVIAGETPVAPFQKGDYDGDVAYFTREIARDPTDPGAHLKRGYAHYLNDDFDLAIVDYTEAIRLNPDDPSAYRHRASAHEDKEQWSEAIADYSEVLRRKPDEAVVWVRRGILLSQRIGDHDAALADLDQAIALEQRPSTYHERGCARQRKGDHDAAIADFDEAIRLDPDKATVFSRTAHAFADRGKSWAAKHQFDRAIADYDRAVVLGITASAYLYRDRGLAKKRQGDRAGAIADFDQALRCHLLSKDRVAVRLERGECHLAGGAPQQAIDDFAEAARLDPANAAAKQLLERAEIERAKAQQPKRRWFSLLRRT